MTQPILSHFQVRPLVAAWRAGDASAPVSLDLGLTHTTAGLGPDGAALPDGQRLSWEALAEIADDEAGCYLVADGAAHKIQRFSELTGRVCSLLPTAGAPTILVAGFIMHRIKGVDPRRDTLNKIRAAAPVRGYVLDTTMGLGYTAIEAARTAEHVTTIEFDPAVEAIAQLNPWSRGLFDNSKITRRLGDSYELVQAFDDGAFSLVIHDPPAFSLAGELYSGAFYQQLYRVLKRNGRVFHYVGSLDSKSGSGVARGVVRRLQAAGFTRVARKPDAFGLLAFK